MTVYSEIPRHDYISDGENDTYPFTFEIYTKTDLKVYVDGVLKVVDIHYTIPSESINNKDGGNVILTAGNIPIKGTPIAIILDLPLTQEIDYKEGDKFPAETHERGLDKLTRIAQAFKTRMKGIFKVPIHSTLEDIEVSIEAGRILGWNDAGNKIIGIPRWDPKEPLPDHHDLHEDGGTDEIKLDDLAEPDDNTDLDFSTSKHGLCPKAPNDITKVLRGDGAWGVLSFDGWIAAEETWTYASATTFTISGDKRGKYQIGDKVKLTQTSAKYFYITGVSYGAPNTTVTVIGGSDYTLADATITNPFYSKVISPQGFPQWFNYIPTGPTNTTLTGRFTVNGRTVICRIRGAVTGTPSFTNMPTLPIPASSGMPSVLAVPACGVGAYEDYSTANRVQGIVPAVWASGTICQLWDGDSAGNQGLVSATVPITWAANDKWSVWFSYEI